MSATIPAYEKLGLFYLGKEVDSAGGQPTDNLFLYKSKDLTTHAAIIGMTGSGKTGLGIGIIEEAAIDNIPAIIIDPKGDMGNLLLAFPELRPADFAPWVDAGAAANRGLSVEEYAGETARTWAAGLESWHQDGERIRKFRDGADFTIYTPGSTAGLPLSVLNNFAAPNPEVLDDPDTFAALVNATVASLLALVDVDADPLHSREYLLLAAIFSRQWRQGQNLDLEELIGLVANPPFKKIGVLPLASFYPQKDRLQLAMLLNNVLASPGFAAWTTGETLDIQNLLYTPDGRARVTILSLAHLNDSQRMFFVTLFLNRYIDWLRRQTGTSSLRTILYMDEIFGFFPATANPPAKEPMLLLLKQARAYGVGIVLATQNPVDLDYKGLANIGSWFIGRLQTRQDKERVLGGLVSGGDQALGKKELRQLLGNLKSRTFLYKSAKKDQPVVFQTRWVLSYLRGPITREEIRRLMAARKQQLAAATSAAEPPAASPAAAGDPDGDGLLKRPPLVAEAIRSVFSYQTPFGRGSLVFTPTLLATGTVRYYRPGKNIDQEETVTLQLFLDSRDEQPDFARAVAADDETLADLAAKPPQDSRFRPLPTFLATARDLKPATRKFADFLYRQRQIELYRQPALKLESSPGESPAAFQARVAAALQEKKEAALDKLRDKYRRREERLQRRYQRALKKLEKEKADVTARTTDTVLSFGMSVLGAFLGRKKVSATSLSRAAGGIRNAGRVLRQKEEVRLAEEEVRRVEQELEDLNAALEEEIDLLAEKYRRENYPVTTFAVKPRRADIYNLDLCLCWQQQ
ncbi:MAG: ATP-binding protein [Deltaproteobacteria bacterium]|nr:ATP-binding protein [Deltaproteobacteria bacterium]